ncbi:hypothetical protein B0H16DRAFT_1505806 [Mycena metata]|uniref:Secreted protein n=1 Tax=Mycena metata TaxID=1033252 RepID=A0AAD7JL92_9AGAR|nr:hypothetical protein B0H16DRAFT_1524746 [Mycena metata]KAJ7776154.1 hypothetical protein B0H16DRAFT_1505806 [Mycena metata]
MQFSRNFHLAARSLVCVIAAPVWTAGHVRRVSLPRKCDFRIILFDTQISRTSAVFCITQALYDPPTRFVSSPRRSGQQDTLGACPFRENAIFALFSFGIQISRMSAVFLHCISRIWTYHCLYIVMGSF